MASEEDDPQHRARPAVVQIQAYSSARMAQTPDLNPIANSERAVDCMWTRLRGVNTLCNKLHHHESVNPNEFTSSIFWHLFRNLRQYMQFVFLASFSDHFPCCSWRTPLSNLPASCLFYPHVHALSHIYPYSWLVFSVASVMCGPPLHESVSWFSCLLVQISVLLDIHVPINKLAY